MSSLRLGKVQTAFLRDVLECAKDGGIPAKWKSAEFQRRSQELIDKLDKSELVKKKRPEGLALHDALRAMDAVCKGAGVKLALPPVLTDEWKGWINNTLRKYGLTAEDCQKLARGAIAKGWRPISFELLIRNAVRYLAEDVDDWAGDKHRGPMELDEL